MSKPTFALPDQLRYGMATLSSRGCYVKQAVVTLYTGQGAVYIQAGSQFIINVPQTGNDCVFDPMNSYLRSKINLASATSYVNITPSGCIDSIFSKIGRLSEQ